MSRPSGIIPHITAQPNWLDKVKNIREAKSEFSKYSNIMTNFERLSINESITKQITEDFPAIYRGMESHLGAYKKDYQDKLAAFQKARQNEIASWDSGKLGTELNTFGMRVDLVFKSVDKAGPLGEVGNPVELITEMLGEAMSSGDRYKQRAAAEVVKSMLTRTNGLPQEQAVQMRLLAKGAADIARDGRLTKDITDAWAAADKAGKELLREKEACIDIAEMLGEYDRNDFFGGGGVGSMAKLIKTVQQDKSGEIKIYAPDAPEVTGVYQKSVDQDPVMGGSNE